ncbi:MAG TPA: DEAD/DEAH box helicase [Candidatus Aphodovivens avistercoris]|nr:DEAD/DEAH box helicase [Candidatus Aphodovivens avistercoris]
MLKRQDIQDARGIRDEAAPEASEPTSAPLAALMRRAEASRADEDLLGRVELLPTLRYGYGEWSARFSIAGPEGAYVLKSVSDFLERMRTGERFAYGKKLAFAHVPEALSERGRAIARVMSRAAAARRRPPDPWERGAADAGRVGRELPLSPAEVAELLDALDGTVFDVEGADAGTRALAHARVSDDAPSLGLRLELASDGGCRIEARESARLVRGGGRMFVWDGDEFRRCPAGWMRCADVLAVALDPETRPVCVARGDLPRFCSTLLPQMEAALPVEVPPELEALKPVPCALRFYFDREGAEIVCEAKAAYGAAEFRVGTQADEGADAGGAGAGGAGAAGGGPVRDERREAKAEALVERYFGGGWLPSPAKLPLAAEAEAGALLYGGLAEFRALGEVLTTPAFDRLLRSAAPRVTFGVSLAGNLLNLTVQAGDLPPAELAALLQGYRKRKHYHRLRNGAFLNLADCDLAQLDQLAADLGVTPAQLASGAVELPSFRAFYLDEEDNLERDRSFDRYLDGFRGVSEEGFAVPASLAGVLRPYQAEGFRWLQARCEAGFGGALADEMGLGKSVQLIALLLARRDEARETGPSLIVCPASLVYNWLAEFERFAPELRVRAVTGTKAERRRALAEAFGGAGAEASGGAGTAEAMPESTPDADGATASAADAPPTAPSPASVHPACDVLVTSYDTLRVDSDAISQHAFYCCALDEAHCIKNPAALITRAAKRVRARHRFALTGTPMENRLSDLWSIFDFLMPGLLGPYTRFRERFELPIAGGDEDAAERLRRLAGPFMLRRRKADVLADLPEKLESTVYVALEGEQRRLYDACEQQLRERLTEQKRVKGGRGKAKPLTPEARAAAATAAAAGDDFKKNRVEVLAELTKLRLLCCDPALVYEDYAGPAAKLAAVAELVESAWDAGQKTLVFSQFTSFLALIGEQLRARRVPFFTITGATPKRTRLELANAFNADDTPALLISLKAGGTGLNLTGASAVIHADPWWNEAAQVQATDRAHRIGQTRAVTVRKVIAKGTIEERIQRLQQAKAQLADQVVGASGTSLAGLSREDLLELLNP